MGARARLAAGRQIGPGVRAAYPWGLDFWKKWQFIIIGRKL